ncbi:TonB-dependent siderophore receptor [Lysobacter silvisoli]|uniref:TonB-dependent siderophore receptor n=1 Tax=Lysobacter silvisoli TaxID=2293254 RepID=A0A371K1U3_9GAMM|nr:TonB-dependent siderophore receptor [Lysobacter silvisoli]RDZ27896.1 TonB-dependent siderophore receptor [Lysobacter silvisoli]
MSRFTHHRTALTLALLVPSVLASALAQAQSAGDEAHALDAVTVVAERATTATKTDTPLTETPQAISVISSDLYTDRGARNLQETLRYSAGVTAEAYGLDTRGDGSSIRGLDPVQYLDGMRKLYNFSPMARPEVYGLERVEVLRGPSSVLYGAGATGGIINAISKRPSFQSAGEVGLQVGNFDRLQLQGDVTGQLGSSGHLAGRIVGVVRDSGMQTDGIDDDRIYLAPSLTWRGERSNLTLMASYQRDRTASSQQFLPVAATLKAPPGRKLDPSTFLGDKDFDKLDARSVSATVLFDHAFNDVVTWRSNLRYIDAKTDFREIFPDTYSNPEDPFIDADDRVLNRLTYGVKPDNRILTADNSLQFDFATGAFRHLLLAGVDYTDFREESWTFSGATTPIDIYDPVSTGVTVPAYTRLPNQRTTQTGLYVQDQIRYADRISLVLGARRDHARSQTQGLPDQTDNATTYRVGVIGDLTDTLSPYVSYSESFLPVPGQDLYGNAFDPMRGHQVEVGLKWQPSRNAMLTAAAYRITETNRQTNDPDNVLNVVQTGEIESKGFELEGAYVFDGDLTVTASYSHNEAEVTKSNFAPEVGRRLNDTPQDLASVWLSKGFQVGDELRLRAGLGGRYVGSTVSTGATSVVRTPSYTLADALLELQMPEWTFAVNVTNLFDKAYYAPCRNFGDCFSGNKRSIVGTVTYRF